MLQLEKSSCPSYFINDPIEAPISRTVEMNKFVEIPVTKISVLHRRLVYGVGINDSLYKVHSYNDNGKKIMCPFYKTWTHMLERCYSNKTQKTQPTYKGCTVCYEWLIFSCFKKWMETQNWKNKQLDKDILIPGNKIYSPDSCLFVDGKINKLLNDHRSNRGKYPQGVSFHKTTKKFRANYSVNCSQKFLGSFDSIDKAELVYKQAKSKHLTSIANEQSDVKLKSGILAHAELMLK